MKRRCIQVVHVLPLGVPPSTVVDNGEIRTVSCWASSMYRSSLGRREGNRLSDRSSV